MDRVQEALHDHLLHRIQKLDAFLDKKDETARTHHFAALRHRFTPSRNDIFDWQEESFLKNTPELNQKYFDLVSMQSFYQSHRGKTIDWAEIGVRARQLEREVVSALPKLAKEGYIEPEDVDAARGSFAGVLALPQEARDDIMASPLGPTLSEAVLHRNLLRLHLRSKEIERNAGAHPEMGLTATIDKISLGTMKHIAAESGYKTSYDQEVFTFSRQEDGAEFSIDRKGSVVHGKADQAVISSLEKACRSFEREEEIKSLMLAEFIKADEGAPGYATLEPKSDSGPSPEGHRPTL